MPMFPDTMELHADSQQSRRFARVPFDAPVRLTRMATGQTLELSALNLSENGVFVETVIPFQVGELFRIHVPNAPAGFEEVAAARVCWRRPFSPTRAPAQPPGVGLSFLFMSPADRESLRALVESGGIAPRERPARAPVAPRIVEPVEDSLPAVPAPAFAGDAMEVMDVGPFGWLLVVALAMAAMASLLLGMQPAGI